MPRFNSPEEKAAYMKRISKVLLLAGVPSVTVKNEAGKDVTVIDPVYLEETSKENRSNEDQISVYMANKNKAYINGWFTSQKPQNASQYFGRIEGDLIDLGTGEAERWNLMMNRLRTTKEGQVRLLKYVTAELLSVDYSTIMDMMLGKKPLEASPKMLRVSRLGFLAANLASTFNEFTAEEMDPALKNAVVRQLTVGKRIYEDYLQLMTRFEYSSSALSQVLPKDQLPDAKVLDDMLYAATTAVSGDPKFAAELMKDAKNLHETITTGNTYRQYQALDERVRRELGEDYVDLLNDRSLIIRDKDGNEVSHFDAIAKLTSKDFPDDEQHKIKDLYTFDHIPEKDRDLLKAFIDEEMKNPPTITEEELKAEKEAHDLAVQEQQKRQSAEDQRGKYEHDTRVMKESCRRLQELITEKMMNSDGLMRNLAERLRDLKEPRAIGADQLCAAALSVIHEYGSYGSSSTKENKLKIALASLAVVKPELARRINSDIRRANPDFRLDAFVNDHEIKRVEGYEQESFDFDWFKNNSHIPADLKTALDKIDKDLDPWYHHNSAEFNMMNRQIKTYLTMIGKKPMSQSLADRLKEQVVEAAAHYVEKNAASPWTDLGDNRLKMAVAVVGVIDSFRAKTLVTDLNKHRSAGKQLDLDQILRMEGLEPHLTREARIGNMSSDIAGENQKAKEARTRYLEGTEKYEAAIKTIDSAKTAYQAAVDRADSPFAKAKIAQRDSAEKGFARAVKLAETKLEAAAEAEKTTYELRAKSYNAYLSKTADYISKAVLRNALASREHDLLQHEEMDRRGVFTLLSNRLAQNKRFGEIFQSLDLENPRGVLPAKMSPKNKEAMEIGDRLCSMILEEQGISKKVTDPTAVPLKNMSLEV